AQHLLAAPEVVEEWMSQWLAGLPEATLLSAPEVAAELLTRAVDQARPGEPRWEVLAGRLATVLHWLGRNEQVEPGGGAVLRTTTDPDLAARMAWTLATAIFELGRPDEALGVCRRALDDPAVPARWRGRLRGLYAVRLAGQGMPGAAAQAETALSEAER